MKVVWKEILASVALSAVALSMIGTDGAAARGKMSKMEPPPNEKVKPVGDQQVDAPAEKGKSATIPVELPTVDTPATERGIKDNGVKGCGNCGLTGKEAAPPPVDDGGTPPSAEWEDPRGGQHMIKDRPVLAAKKKGPKERDKPASNTSLLSIVGGVTAIAAIVALAAGGGDDNPTSP